MLRYLVLCGSLAADTIMETQGVYSDWCLSKATIYQWHKAFGEVQNLVELIRHARWLRTVGIEVNANTIALDCGQPTRFNSSIAGWSEHFTNDNRRIVKELGMCSFEHMGAAMPHQGTDVKAIEVFGEWLLMMDSNGGLLTKIVTGDETWVRHVDPCWSRNPLPKSCCTKHGKH